MNKSSFSRSFLTSLRTIRFAVLCLSFIGCVKEKNTQKTEEKKVSASTTSGVASSCKSQTLVYVLDDSASMQGKMEEARKVVLFGLKKLAAEDCIAIVRTTKADTFAFALQAAQHAGSLGGELNAISPQGESKLDQAFRTALLAFDGVQSPSKHVLFLSDGAGEEGELEAILKQFKEKGIKVSAAGMTKNVDRPLLKKISEWGGGSIAKPRDIKFPGMEKAAHTANGH